ncbi:MAG: hypothetical protein ACOH5I_24390 [Oligoflexus sp.]
MEEKVLSVNLDLMKKRVADKARDVAAKVSEKVTSTSKAAKTRKDEAVSRVLDRSIELLEKQRKKHK